MADAMLNAPQFDQHDVEILERKTLYQGFFRAEKITLRHKLFGGGWTPVFSREIFLRGDAVGVLLYDPERDLVGLVEQFRIGATKEARGPWCLEVVAGMVEDGETPEAVARRELVEEAGITQARLIPICHYLPSPGGSDETMTLFCALCDLSGAAGFFGLAEEHEDIKVHVLPGTAVQEQLYRGLFNNAAVLICLQWLTAHREQLQKDSCSTGD